MLFGKKKSFADKYFFDDVKKTTKNMNKELKQTNDYVKDIDGMRKIYEKDKSPKEVAELLLFREDKVILTILRQTAILYNNKGIIISQKQINDLCNEDNLIYDRILSFLNFLLSQNIEIDGRREIFDFKLTFCKNSYIMEKNRIKYIKKSINKDVLDSIQPDYRLNTFFIILKDCIEKRGAENIIDTILYVLNGLPEGYYDENIFINGTK